LGKTMWPQLLQIIRALGSTVMGWKVWPTTQ